MIEADEAAYAHWHRVAQEAQAKVARITKERDEAVRERESARNTRPQFALRLELEQALGVGDSYAYGALEAALARVKALQRAESERDEALETIRSTRASAYDGELSRLRRELSEALDGREREYQRAEEADALLADLVARWSHESEIIACGQCWRPVPDDTSLCPDCCIDYHATPSPGCG